MTLSAVAISAQATLMQLRTMCVRLASLSQQLQRLCGYLLAALLRLRKLVAMLQTDVYTKQYKGPSA